MAIKGGGRGSPRGSWAGRHLAETSAQISRDRLCYHIRCFYGLPQAPIV